MFCYLQGTQGRERSLPSLEAEVASKAEGALQPAQGMQDGAMEPPAALKSNKQGSKACPPGCCSSRSAQDDSFLSPLADILGAQASHKRASIAQPISRNVSQRSVCFSLDLETRRAPLTGASGSADASSESCKSSQQQGAAAVASQQASSLSASSAFLDTMPLGPVEMDYNFTERGVLPEGLEASRLAAAFGPEPRADEAPQPDGVSARIQVGDALVALLEHHHKHRYAVATADPDEVAASKGIVGSCAGDEPVELDRRARSLTRSLARSASSSPLVQLLAMHRKRRENLTGWQDESALPKDDSATSTTVPLPPPSLDKRPPKMQLQPEISKAQLGEELTALVAASRGAASFGGNFRSGFPGLHLSPPGHHSGPPSLRSGSSSVRSAHSAAPSSSGSSAGSAHFGFSAPPSLAGSGSERAFGAASTPGPPGAPPALATPQCPGCGSMTSCCCKDMDLASHPSLEGSLETGVDLTAPGSASQSSSSASMRSVLPDAPDAHSSTIRKMLAAQLTAQAPSSGSKAAAVGGGTTPQKLIEASRGASFNEVLARCLSVGSDQTSPIVKAAAGDEQIIAPFIPIDTGSLGKLEIGQSLKLGKPSRWSFDSALLTQYVHGRPGIVERRSMDGVVGSVTDSGEARPSYTSLMAAYRERLGMSSASSSLATSIIEAPSASDAISGALKQALRSQLTTPASSRRCSEDTPSAAATYREQALPPQPPPQRNSSELQPPPTGTTPQLADLAQLALSSQFFGSSPQGKTSASPLPLPQPLLRRCSSERRRSGSWLPTVDESPPTQPDPESPVALAPHDAAAAAKARLFCAMEDGRGALPSRHSIGALPASMRPPMSPRRMSTSAFTVASEPGTPLEAGRHAPALGDASVRRLSCARIRSNAAQQVLQQGASSAQAAAAAAATATASSRLFQRNAPLGSSLQAASPGAAQPDLDAEAGDASKDGEAKESQRKPVQAPSDTAGVLAAVAQQLAGQRDTTLGKLPEAPAADLAPMCHGLRPLRVPSAAPDKRVAANNREPSLAHFVQDGSLDGSGSEEDGSCARNDNPPPQDSGTDVSTSAAPSTAQMCASAPAAAAAADGRRGAASRGAAARALFSMDQSADAASRAVVRSFGRAREVRGGDSRAKFPPASAPSDASGGTKTILGMQAAGEPEPRRRSVTFSPGTPPVRSEPAPFSPERLLTSLPLSSAEEIVGSGTQGSLFLVGGPAVSSFSGHPVLTAPLSMPSILPPGKQLVQPAYSSPSGSHELLETYGAHRVRAETVRAEALRCGSGAQTRLGLGLMPPSAMWVEHRAGAHVSPVLHHRGHCSMDAIRNMPPDAFSPSSGLLPYPHPVFEGTPENMEKQRRDSYLARTLSNMARVRLDHAMALAAEKDGPPEKWEMSFTDDGPGPTFGRTSGSEEGAISRAKRMMAEAAAAHPSHAYFTDGNIARRDADGITALLDVLATPKTAAEMQERALSTIAFLATSAANAKILVASNGVPVLVPLLGARSDGVVIAAGGILRRLLPLPNGQASIPLHSSAAFVEENGLAILTSLLSASKSTPVLLSALRTLITLAEAPGDGAAGDGAAHIAGCGAVPAAVRLACPTAYGGDAFAVAAASAKFGAGAKSGAGSGAKSGDSAGANSGDGGHIAKSGTVDPVPLAALALLLKLAGRPDLRTALRSANLMGALASMMVPGAAEALLTPAIQLTAMLASDMAAAAEFAARGGVIGLMALVSDGGDKEGVIAVQAAAVLGCLVQCSRARSAVWAAGGGSTLLPALLEASPLALSGVLYLMSCLAEFKDLRAELESADAVPMLLDLLATCTDTQIQAATVSLLRIFTRSGETLCPILEHQTTSFSEAKTFETQRPVQMERRSFDSCQKKQAERKPDLPAPHRSQSLSLF